MLNKFSEYYEKNIKPYEKEYNTRIKNALKNDKLREKNCNYAIWSFAIFSFLATVFLVSCGIYNSFIHFLVVLIIDFAVIIRFILNSLGESVANVRDEIKNKIIIPLIENFCSSEYTDSLNKTTVFKSGFWQDIYYWDTGDTIVIDEDFLISEVKIYLKNNNIPYVGAIVDYKIDNYLYGDIELKMIDKLSGAKMENKELEKVKLENVEFKKFFDVYASKQIAARMVMTVYFMERMVELKKRLNRNINVNVIDGRIYLIIDNFFIIDEERIIKNGLSEGELYYNIKNIEQTITLIKNIFNSI